MKLSVFFILVFITDLPLNLSGYAKIEKAVEEQSQGYNRIIKGNKAKPGQFKHQVTLIITFLDKQSALLCGGAMICSNWVLTAAHCVDGSNSVTIGYGSIELAKPTIEILVDAKNITMYPGWNPKTLLHDIALIRTRTVATTDNIEPVKLPNISETYSAYAGEYGIASGFGKTNDSINIPSSILMWTELKFITNSECSLTYDSLIQASNVCVATVDGTPCRGDSGGPVTLKSTKQLVGLISFSADAGCDEGFPAVFTRVTSYLTWIEEVTGECTIN